MNIKDFLHAHPALTHAQDMRDICAPLDLLDIVYFSHVHIDEQQRFSGLGIVPEFFKVYFNRGYYNFDLHMSKPRMGEEYILWDFVQRKKQSQSLHEDFMSFNQGHTFSIVINHDTGRECFHFATKLGNESMNGKYFQLLSQLKQFISYFKDKVAANKALSSAYQLKIPLQTTNSGFFTEEAGFDLQKFTDSIQANRIYSILNNQYLTKREMECLSWLSKARTFAETALILNISERTVKAHVNAMKEKLGCASQFQLGMYFSKLALS